jgi:glycosyltransferase involved in cell wall biosynthesis
MQKLSVALATYNEAHNIKTCLDSVAGIADEIIVVDGGSTDRTVEIARTHGAKVTITKNHPIFHINKQKALDLSQNEWVLQLDADEIVTDALAHEIQQLLKMSTSEIEEHQENLPNKKLFDRHTRILEKRDGNAQKKTTNYVAFFMPRKNFFLGKYLMHGGVYPDGVIRLIRKKHAHFPAKSVHEQMVIEGRVGWLQNDLIHMDSPTFSKYLMRWHRYTRLIATEIREERKKTNPLVLAMGYMILRPGHWFVTTYARHKGFLDSWQGFVFSLFSSLRFPMGYIKYLASADQESKN